MNTGRFQFFREDIFNVDKPRHDYIKNLYRVVFLQTKMREINMFRSKQKDRRLSSSEERSPESGYDSSPSSPSPLSLTKDNNSATFDTPSHEKKSPDSGWIDIPDIKKVSINGWLYNKLGIVAVRESKNRKDLITEGTFTFGAGEFMYGDITDIEANLKKGIAPKTILLFNKLQQFADSNDPQSEALRTARSKIIEGVLQKTGLIQKPLQIPNESQAPSHRSSSRRTQKKSKKLLQPSQANNKYNILHVIQEYAEEKNTQIIYKRPNLHDPQKTFDPIAFLPFAVTQHRKDTEENTGERFGFKIHPWLSSGVADKFNPDAGFTTYVIASCMFGASIKGQDDIENSFSIIKHDIQFHSGQRIESIKCEQSSFYETAQLTICKKIVPLMKRLGDFKFQVYCHLPSIDYMLFGIRLYIEGKMTEDALEDFFVEVIEKKNELTNHFKKIFREEDGINITIASPFDNLLSEIKKDESGKISTGILKALGLAPTDGSGKKITQQEVVRQCLKLITENDIQPMQAEVWRDVVSIAGGVEKINTLEELFKYGNAVMLATAAKGKKSYEVCSIQPYSEMQIQKAFAKLSKPLGRSYAPICNLTYFDPILGYDINSKAEKRRGVAFYYPDVNKAVNNLHRFFMQGFKNAVSFPDGQEYLSLEKSRFLVNK